MASDAERDITAPPADKQVIVHDGKRYTTVKEGLAYILLPESAEEAARQPKDSDEVQNVFYNPIQQFNRDLTVLAIRAYGKERLREKLAMRQDKRSRFPDKKRKRHDANAGDSRPAKTQKVASHGEEAADPPRGDQLEQQQQHEPATGGGTDATAAASSAVGGAAAPAAAADAAEPTTTETTVDGPAEGDFSSQKVQAPHQPRFTILDALSATGLRALRYAHEIPFVTSVTSNDLLATATETIRLNVRHNGLQGRVHVSHDDAVAHMAAATSTT
ncbi:hypothetical protein VTK73DRAFT_1060 [Phialemonium thermophilum]|uniref:tRNA (guanine(26)-N(2))-dimethyltransferase n=1 Tax=Phialemonium thermophilum TaxID=223376 RepID=A0ABR3VU45_9PEZI